MHDNYRKQTLDALMSAAAQRRGDLPPALKEGMKVPLMERDRDVGRDHYSAQEATQILCANTLNKNEAI